MPDSLPPSHRPRELRETTLHLDTPEWVRLRLAAVVFGALAPVLGWPGHGWAHLLFAPMWAGWAWLWIGILQLLVGPRVELWVDHRRRVHLDGEWVADWRADARVQQSLLTDEAEIASFVDHRAGVDEVSSPVVERRAALDGETWTVESHREDWGLSAVGWGWLLLSPLGLLIPAEVPAFVAPAVAFILLLGLAIAMLAVHGALTLTGADVRTAAIRLTPDRLIVGEQPLELAKTVLEVRERQGFATLWAWDPRARVRVAHHHAGPVRLLAQELRARVQAAGERDGEVPEAIERLRQST